MGEHYDEDGDGVADQGDPPIGDLENETIFVPEDQHVDPEGESDMRMGRGYVSPENDLRDPWFHTEEGAAWLAEDADAAREAGQG